MNIAMLTGRITDVPELRKTNDSKSVTSFCIADNRDNKHVSFVDCVAWGNTAEFVCKYFAKGDWISCTGFIQTRLYKDKNGSNRKAVEVIVDRVGFCGNKVKADIDTVEETPVTDAGDLPF